jgi:hypothetical protein
MGASRTASTLDDGEIAAGSGRQISRENIHAERISVVFAGADEAVDA